uniref:Uncharacterized protein n=1 Tax=Meloidogyne enterolobii TaxID=390850 RepID=A0A6V7TR42_MELEN|nr:unnamed protein product [Meloidogyne enterolobii]
MYLYLTILLIYLNIIFENFFVYPRLIITTNKLIEEKQLNNKKLFQHTSNKKLPDEKQRQKNREEFSKKVQNIPIRDDHAEAIFQHWVDQAYSSLFAAIANQRLKTLKKPIRDDFGHCSKHATNIPLHAKCLSDLFNGNFKGKNFTRKKNSRLERYRDRQYNQQRQNVVEMRNKIFQKLRDDHNKIMSDTLKNKRTPEKKILTNPTQNKSKDHTKIAPKNSKTNQPQIIMRKNFYGLHTTHSRLSPLGRIARDLMKKVLKAKGKHEKDVVPWQKTVERLRDSAKRRKEIKKNFEEGDSPELGHLTYRGLKRQGAFGEVEDDLNEIAEDPQKIFKFLEKLRSENIQRKRRNLLAVLFKCYVKGLSWATH